MKNCPSCKATTRKGIWNWTQSVMIGDRKSYYLLYVGKISYYPKGSAGWGAEDCRRVYLPRRHD